jgi:hypothetical protein
MVVSDDVEGRNAKPKDVNYNNSGGMAGPGVLAVKGNGRCA